MITPSYIPATDGALASFLLNLATLITANPTNYGLVSGDAVVITNASTTFSTNLALAVDPVTRTPVSVAQKDATRVSSIATVRPYCQQIRLDSSVSDALKVGLGLNLTGTPPTPIPAPGLAPLLSSISASTGVHNLIARNPDAPTTKAMPFGSIGVQIFSGTSTTGAVPLVDCAFLDIRTKQPMAISTSGIPSGTRVTYFARYQTRGGPGGAAQFGPWSEATVISVL